MRKTTTTITKRGHEVGWLGDWDWNWKEWRMIKIHCEEFQSTDKSEKKLILGENEYAKLGRKSNGWSME